MLSIEEISAQILEDKPFPNILVNDPVLPLSERELHRGDVCLVGTRNLGLCKLRVCTNSKYAKDVEYSMNTLPTIFPTFLGRDRKYILTDYLEEWAVMTDSKFINSLSAIGNICGHIHSIPPNRPYNPTKRFLEKVGQLSQMNHTEKKLLEQTKKVFGDVVKKCEIAVCLDLSDIHRNNFMVSTDNDILLVDGDSVKSRMKGAGFPGLRKRLSDDDWNTFLSGYESKSDPSFLSPEYWTLLTLDYAVRKILYRSRERTNISSIPELVEMINESISNYSAS